MENLEKQSKMKNVRIVGLPEESPTEDLMTKIKKLTQDLELNQDETLEGIDTVLRLGKPTKKDTDKPRQVLLTFKSIEGRNKFIRNRRKLKGKRRGLVILEDLTKGNAGKYYNARQLYNLLATYGIT